MTRFEQLISSGTGALARRANALSTTAMVEQQSLVGSLKAEKANLEVQLMNLTDLAPESTVSLRPGSKDWDAKKWVSDVQRVKEDLYIISNRLRLAEETFNEYFTEVKNNE
jgi:hypothetical protein